LKEMQSQEAGELHPKTDKTTKRVIENTNNVNAKVGRSSTGNSVPQNSGTNSPTSSNVSMNSGPKEFSLGKVKNSSLVRRRELVKNPEEPSS